MVLKKVLSMKNSQLGMVLPMALILMVIASIIIVPGLAAMQSFMIINSDTEQNTMAYYAADAGVADCIWKYKYGTAPTVSYTLNNINGMNVDVTLLPQSTAQNFFWQSSAPSGLTSRAKVVIGVTQTGAQGNDIFDKAAVSLDGDITMSGGCKVVSDDIFIVYYCDAAWTRSFTTITCSAVTTPRETGVYYDLGKSSKMVMTAAAGVGNLAYRNTGTKDISPYKYISAWIYSSVALNLGDLQFKIATNTALGGTVESINIPAIPANTGTRVLLTIGTPANFSSLDSIGIYQAVDKGAFTLYVDNVIATNNLSMNGDIYANGNISIQPSAIVNGTASATGTISVNTGGGAIVWGTQTPSAPTYTPQAINIQSYIDLATGPGSTHYTSWPGWTSGTHNLGPAYFDTSISIGGSNTIVLTGDIWVNGTLTITGGALVKGPYTIVANEITVSGGSSVMLAKGNVPLMISQYGDFHISNSAQIAAIVYAPNGQVHISGGVGPNGYNLYGAAVGKSVLMEGSTQIKYLSGIRTMPWPAGWGLGPGPGQSTGVPTVVGYDYR